MYKRILVPLEHSPYDAAIVEHIRMLARECGSSIVLIHVADGFAARNVKQLNLRESEEMRLDREYLEQTCASLKAEGFNVESLLAGGDPSKEIAEAAAREQCDLIAMSTHGHKFIKDMLYGSVANEVRHLSRVPVLLVRGERKTTPHGPSS
jgi:nucleotide-binding universal stress UspA family protein